MSGLSGNLTDQTGGLGGGFSGQLHFGTQGPPGPQGAPGNPGKSAYQYAVDGGYTGTEAEFAEKLASESGGVTTWEDLGSTFEEGTVLAETTVVIDPESGEGGTPDVISLTIGNDYTVNWNGVPYKCIAEDMSAFAPGIAALGDIGFAESGEPTEGSAPFVILVIPADMIEAMGGMGIAIMSLDGSESVTLSISERKEVVNQIPDKYVPKADWNAAEGEPGHVLNRTHYEETVVVNFPETEIPVGDTMTPFMYNIPIVVGHTYTVTWNGIEYECAGIYAGTNGVVIGNTSILGTGVDSGEPFILLISNKQEEDGSYGDIVCIDGSTTAILSLKGENKVVHKLPGKYVDADIINSLETIDLILQGPASYTSGSYNLGMGPIVIDSLKKGFVKVSFALECRSTMGSTEIKQVTVLLMASGSTQDYIYSAFGTIEAADDLLIVKLTAQESGMVRVNVTPIYTHRPKGGGIIDRMMFPVITSGDKCYGLTVDENGTLQTYDLYS